ncbi:MAG: (d)CMP kinase [Gammaproteobacteria bacterium]|nr:(d)CMP kinase [Gammaproteobacteria bacterium]
MSLLQNKSVLIVGLGLIGGSVARGLRSGGLCRAIYACGRDERPLQQAQADGVIDEWSTDLKSIAVKADVILICVPTLTVRRVFEDLKGVVSDTTILTDAASVKGSVVEDFQAVFGNECGQFVPAHPIAGSEQTGYLASNTKLFMGRKVILTPLANTDRTALLVVTQLWQALGALVNEMHVDTHDAVLAATSHLPHLLAFSLVNTLAHEKQTEDIFRYAAGGFAGFTRIASSDPVMWRDIFLANGPATVAVLDAYVQELGSMRDAIVAGDGDLLRSRFQSAKDARDSFVRKHFSNGNGVETYGHSNQIVPAQKVVPVLTIDGPGGSGKGTISARIAQTLGWHYLDSGALYRLLGLAARRAGVSTGDEALLLPLIERMRIRFGPDQGAIWLDDEEVSSELRTETSGAAASEVAVHPAVRQALLELQHDFRQMPGLVADGRDMGTVVFPDAQLKIYLTASVEERANRRYKQLIAKGIDVNLSDLFVDITARDERDSSRAASPLRPADDALLIDTTEIGIEQVVALVLDLIRQRYLST